MKVFFDVISAEGWELVSLFLFKLEKELSMISDILDILGIVFILVGFPSFAYVFFTLMRETHSAKFLDRSLIKFEIDDKVEEITKDFEKKLDKRFYTLNITLTDSIVKRIKEQSERIDKIKIQNEKDENETN